MSGRQSRNRLNKITQKTPHCLAVEVFFFAAISARACTSAPARCGTRCPREADRISRRPDGLGDRVPWPAVLREGSCTRGFVFKRITARVRLAGRHHCGRLHRVLCWIGGLPSVPGWASRNEKCLPGIYLAGIEGLSRDQADRTPGRVTAPEDKEAGGLTCWGACQPLRFQRGDSLHGLRRSCCRPQAASRPCLRCRHGSFRCPWTRGRP